MSECRTIAIVNNKGGVGKTTSTLSLGYALAEAGWRVLVVDIDPQANLSDGVGVLVEEQTVADALLAGLGRDWPDPPQLQTLIRRAVYPRLDLLPAPAQSDDSDLLYARTAIVAGDSIGGHRRLAGVLAPVAGDYDAILIDCPPQIDILVWNALFAADEVIVPIRPERHAVMGLASLTRMLERARDAWGTQTTLAGVLAIGDRRQLVTRHALAELDKAGFPVFDTMVPLSVAKAAQAQELRTPIGALWPDGIIASCYRQIATQLMAASATSTQPEEQIAS